MADGLEIHEIPPILEQFLERGLRIPPCPAVLTQLAEAVRDPEKQSSELARLLKMDPALTTALLDTRICMKARLHPEQATQLGVQIDQEIQALMSI